MVGSLMHLSREDSRMRSSLGIRVILAGFPVVRARASRQVYMVTAAYGGATRGDGDSCVRSRLTDGCAVPQHGGVDQRATSPVSGLEVTRGTRAAPLRRRLGPGVPYPTEVRIIR